MLSPELVEKLKGVYINALKEVQQIENEARLLSQEMVQERDAYALEDIKKRIQAL